MFASVAAGMARWPKPSPSWPRSRAHACQGGYGALLRSLQRHQPRSGERHSPPSDAPCRRNRHRRPDLLARSRGSRSPPALLPLRPGAGSTSMRTRARLSRARPRAGGWTSPPPRVKRCAEKDAVGMMPSDGCCEIDAVGRWTHEPPQLQISGGPSRWPTDTRRHRDGRGTRPAAG
jgi:hypothetical protein